MEQLFSRVHKVRASSRDKRKCIHSDTRMMKSVDGRGNIEKGRTRAIYDNNNIVKKGPKHICTRKE